MSLPFLAISGVPQGSHLGPLLFLLFIDGFMNTIDCHGFLCADDTEIYCYTNSSADCLLAVSDGCDSKLEHYFLLFFLFIYLAVDNINYITIVQTNNNLC